MTLKSTIIKDACVVAAAAQPGLTFFPIS